MSKDADILGKAPFAEGAFGSFRFAVRTDGSMPAKLILDAINSDDLRSFRALCRALSKRGVIVNEFQKRELSKDVFELRRGGVSLSCWQIGRVWYLGHGIRCNGDDAWTDKDLTIALEIRQEHSKRIA